MPYCTVVVGGQAGGLGHLLQYMPEFNAESTKQGRKRFNYQVRPNTLPIWVYNLSMLYSVYCILGYVNIYTSYFQLFNVFKLCKLICFQNSRNKEIFADPCKNCKRRLKDVRIF